MVLPLAFRHYQRVRHTEPSLYGLLQADTELRMLLGFINVMLACAIFAAVGALRALMIEAGEFGDLAVFTAWAKLAIMAPNSVLFCMGIALVLWDGLASRGKHICLFLLVLAALFWMLGTFGGHVLIELLWGENHGAGSGEIL